MANKRKVDKHGNPWCPRCKTHKPLEDFYPPAPAHRGDHSPHCKRCTTEIGFIQRQKVKIRQVGVEAYRKQIDFEQEQLAIKYETLNNFEKEV